MILTLTSGRRKTRRLKDWKLMQQRERSLETMAAYIGLCDGYVLSNAHTACPQLVELNMDERYPQ